MNTKPKKSAKTDVYKLDKCKLFPPVITEPESKIEDMAIIHEAKIITPQPYGVFALCKLVEHLQIN